MVKSIKKAKVASTCFLSLDPNLCVGKSDGLYRNKNNCYGYYECTVGRTFPRNCEAGKRFNGNHCVSAAQYVCP